MTEIKGCRPRVDNNDFVLFPRGFGRCIIPANEEKRQLIFRTYTEQQQGTAMKLTNGSKWKEEER